MPEHEPQQFDACDVCGRTILRGERIFDYLTPDREDRGVCALCRERAEADGWVRADSEGALIHAAAPRRRRGLRRARLRERMARAGERVRSATARSLPDERPDPFGSPPPEPFEPPRPGSFDPSPPTHRERSEPRPTPVPDPEFAPTPAPDPLPAPGPLPVSVPSQEPEPPGAGEPDLDREEAQGLATSEDEPVPESDPDPDPEPEPEPVPEPVPPPPEPEPDTPERRMGRAVARFNQGEHPRVVAGLMRSLGEPRAAVEDLSAEPPRAQVSIAWELSWYRWEVSVDSEEDAVREVAKGGDVAEFDSEPDWNATVGSDGELLWPSASS